jgi:hypothetical protein
MGLGQFMPETWKEYGQGADPYDPAASLDASARYMRDLLKRYNGDYTLALAAYNAGMGNVDKHGGVPPFKETQNYVETILGGIDPRMAGDMTGALTIDPNTLPDKMSMNEDPGMGPLHQYALNQVMGLLADKPQQPMSTQDMALALGAGILQARPGQNWMAPGAQALMQARQAHQQQQVDRPGDDAYRAQTLLHAMNQFGASAMSPAERARAIQAETWQSPDGTDVRVFRYDTATKQYLGEAPPPGWNITDRAIPIVPGMAEGQEPPAITPTAKMKEAQFLFPDDVEAQREYVQGDGKKGAGGEGASAKVEGYKLALNRLMDQVITPLENNPRARAALGTLGKPGAFASGAADIVDFMAGTDLRERVKSFYGGVDPKIINETIRTSTMPVARLMVDDKGPLSGPEQAQAKALLGQYEKQGFLGPEQGFELLMLTAEALRRQVAAMGGETLPPTTDAAPPQKSGSSPYVFKDVEKERRYQEWLRNQGAR